jgi:hypothetical protein
MVFLDRDFRVVEERFGMRTSSAPGKR